MHPKMRKQKMVGERTAMEKIRHLMGEGSGGYFRNLRLEFEEKQMYEEKVADVPEKVAAQRNAPDLYTWQPVEHEMTFMRGWIRRK